jgi:hypothetical protein
MQTLGPRALLITSSSGDLEDIDMADGPDTFRGSNAFNTDPFGAGGNQGSGQGPTGGGFFTQNLLNELAQSEAGKGKRGKMGSVGNDIENAWIPGANQAGFIFNKGLPELDPNNYLANTMAGLNGTNPYGEQMGQFDPTNQGIGGFDAFTNGGSNPYADQMFDISAAKIRDQINSQFGSAGQGSSSGNLDEQISQLGDYGAKFYGDIYNADQDRALQATQGRVNAYQGQNQLGLDALSGAATANQNQINSAGSFLPGIQAQIQNQPYNNLSQYANIIGQLTGSSPQQAKQPGAEGSSGFDKLLGVGAIAASFYCSGDWKEDKRPGDVLDKLMDVQVEFWKYHSSFNDQADHISPYAEEFNQAFGVGEGKTINPIDAFGVALRAVQELTEEVRDLRRQINGGAA